MLRVAYLPANGCLSIMFGDAFCAIYPYGQARCLYHSMADLTSDLASLGLTLTVSGEIVVA